MKYAFVLLAGALVALPVMLASASLPETSSVTKAANFIRGTQQADGGFGGFGDGQTFDAVYALRASGLDPATVKKDGKSPVDFLKAKAAAQNKPASAGKAALAARALGVDPKSVGGKDLIAVINGGLMAATGRYADDDFSQSIAMLGLACTGGSVPASAVTALRTAQIADGGWGFKGASDADTTAIALQALIASGAAKSDAAVVKAVAYFVANQGKDGGWGFDPAESNASSTAFSVQALIAAGESVESAKYTKTGVTPVKYLLGQQEADGSFKGFDPAFAANQVTPALAGRTFCNAIDTPITVVVPAPTAVATPPTPTSPTATSVAPKPVAPLPPSTGSGTGNDAPIAWLLLGLGMVGLPAVSVAALKARRR